MKKTLLMDEKIQQYIQEIAQQCIAKNRTIACAESCTGGGLGYALTSISGSSTWFVGGFITYSNQAKQDWLGVSADILAEHGAVSEVCVKAMVQGVLFKTKADLGIAITGIAGPTGATPDKPVGTIWLGWGRANQAIQTKELKLSGTREEIRQQTISQAIFQLAKFC